MRPSFKAVGVYYTDLHWGDISFAILEDRKFKTSPEIIKHYHDVVIDGGHIIAPQDFDGCKADVPGAQLLGERQLAFLHQWSQDWSNNIQMKAVLSQTLFANLQTRGADNHLDKDTDSNGWPQSGRHQALQEMRRGLAIHISGDQHLASVIHHGIDTWEDASWGFTLPAIANLAPRHWRPQLRGSYSGRYFDGFGNRMTVSAVANPFEQHFDKLPEPVDLHQKAPGYGIIKLNKHTRMIEFEAWPRYADPHNLHARQYPGWPIRIHQLDNYGASSPFYLPTLKVIGLTDPVVKIMNHCGEISYTLRIKGSIFQPKVLKPGHYTLAIGDPKQYRLMQLPARINNPEVIEIRF